MINVRNLTDGVVHLKPYEEQHYQQTVDWLNSQALRESFGISITLDLDSHIKWIESQKNYFIWAIYNSDYIGNILIKVNERHHSGYLQIYIGNEAYHGKGIGFRVLSLVLDELFTQSLHRVWLHCFRKNAPAMKLYKKIGFIEEGEERESIYRDGQFHNQVRMSILRQEWRLTQ